MSIHPVHFISDRHQGYEISRNPECRLQSRLDSSCEDWGISESDDNRLALSEIRTMSYDGPRGAVLKFSSILSLHEPLMGKLFRSGRFNARKFDRILDVGSSRQIINICWLKVVQKSSASTCRGNAATLGTPQIGSPLLVAADMRSPCSCDNVDCVTCGYVLEYLPDPAEGLREFARVLRPGGVVLLLATEDSFSGLMTSHTWKCRTFNRDELRSAAESSGLQWSRVHWFTRFHEMLKLGGILVELEKT